MNEHKHANQACCHRTLQVGPLCYQMRAYDTWGCGVLEQLFAHLQSAETGRAADRIVHLLSAAPESVSKGERHGLPADFRRVLPGGVAAHGWQCHRSRLDTTWFTPQSTHTFWNAATDPVVGSVRFQLPWGLIIEDIVTRGGGLVHGGLAGREGSGLLFLAPPGGGKSTTLSSAPSDWQVFSDDAALIWPQTGGDWLASPLPAWGNVIAPGEEWRYHDLVLARSIALKGIVVLEKTLQVHLHQLKASEVLPDLYRAFGEYPAAVIGSAQRWEQQFRTAAQLVRDLRGWRLGLPLHGDVWALLSREAV